MAELVLTLAIGLQAPAPAQRNEATLRPAHLDMVISSSLFHAVNRGDATAALRVWGDNIAHRRGYALDSSIEIVDDAPALRKRLQAGMPGLVAMDVLEYFKLADISALEPAFYGWVDPKLPLRYLLLVRADSGIHSIEDLRGKSVLFHAGTSANLAQVWFDSLLYDNRVAAANHFWRSTEAVGKASSAVLPLFFGKVDAAVVEQSAFEVIREMNPQVGAHLRILSTSPTLIEAVICLNARHEFRQDLYESMRDLHLDVQGRQILTVFRFGRLVPMDQTALEQVRELWKKHLQMSRPAQVRMASVPGGTL